MLESLRSSFSTWAFWSSVMTMLACRSSSIRSAWSRASPGASRSTSPAFTFELAPRPARERLPDGDRLGDFVDQLEVGVHRSAFGIGQVTDVTVFSVGGADLITERGKRGP